MFCTDRCCLPPPVPSFSSPQFFFSCCSFLFTHLSRGVSVEKNCRSLFVLLRLLQCRTRDILTAKNADFGGELQRRVPEKIFKLFKDCLHPLTSGDQSFQYLLGDFLSLSLSVTRHQFKKGVAVHFEAFTGEEKGNSHDVRADVFLHPDGCGRGVILA